jgi:hypothetical protein
MNLFVDGLAQAMEATPFFERLCPAMTNSGDAAGMTPVLEKRSQHGNH